MNRKRFCVVYMGMKDRRIGTWLALALAALATMPCNALTCKTMCHYVAYEIAFWPENTPVTADNYRKIRLNGFSSLPMDALVFAPVLGFGSMAANLRTSSPLLVTPASDSVWLRGYKNGMGEMLKAGWDPISETAKWCKEKKKECIVALPVNIMAHGGKPDSKRSPGSWYAYLWPPFKTQNPTCLMGGADGSGPGGLHVDYGEAKVRDTFAAIACEIASKYEIDAIMVDFMMYPRLLKGVAAGGTASAKEVEAITQMMSKIRTACRGKIAFGARVPDSVGYCQAIGIGLKNWLESKLLDFVVLGGSFQLNKWKVTGELAAKSGIPYYVSFCPSGIYVGNDSGWSGDDERLPRQSRQTYAARITDAMLDKAAGCMYSFGMHHEHTIAYGEVVPFDEAKVRSADKRYFVTYTNDRAAGGELLKDDAKFHGLPSLLSGSPVDLAGGLVKYKIEVWDNLAERAKAGESPKATLVTEASIPSGIETVVMFNGKEYKPFKKRAGTQLYDIPPAAVKYGANEVSVKAKGRNKRGQTAKLGNIAVEIAYPKKDTSGEAGK